MHLDIRTVFLLIAFCGLVLGIGLLAAARSYAPPPRGIKLWALASAGLGVSFSLSALRGQIPDEISIVFANSLMMLSFITYYHAVKDFKGETFNRRLFYPLVGVCVLLLVYFNYFSPSVLARSVIVSGFGAFASLLSAGALLLGRDSQKSFSHKLTGGVFLFCGAVGGYRVANLLFIDEAIQSIFDRSLSQDLHISGLFIGVVVLTFGFVLMINDKINAELSRALADVKTLSALLPICSYCKNIRDDQNYWQSIESYVTAHTGSKFSHGICPECFEKEVRPRLNKMKAVKN